MKKTLLMYVYNDISTDARVQRAATALSDLFETEIIANDSIDQKFFTIHVLSESKSTGVKRYLENILAFCKYTKTKHWDCFYANDFYSAIPALFMKKHGLCDKLIYDAHELYIPQSGVKMSIRDKLFYFFEKKAICSSDLVIAAQEDRARLMKEFYRLDTLPITIRNISAFNVDGNSELLSNIVQEQLDNFMKLPQKTLVYAGAITSSRGLYELCDIAENYYDKIKLLIVGDGPIKDKLKEYTKSKKNIGVCFLGKIPYRAMPEVLNRCDIGYLYYENDCLNNRFCSPNKVYEYSSCGLVILANDNDGVKRELAYLQTGISTNDLASGLNELLQNYKTYSSRCIAIDFNKILHEEMQQLKTCVSGMLNGEK